MIDLGELVSADQALESVRYVFGEKRAKAILQNMLLNCKLLTSAKCIVNALYVGNGSYRHVDPALIPAEQVEILGRGVLYPFAGIIPPSAWKKSVDWKGDCNQWDWEAGNFQITTGYDPLPYRIVIFGLSFRAKDFSDVSRFRRYTPADADLIKDKPPAKAKFDWETVLINLIVLTRRGRLHEAIGHVPERRRKNLVEWLSENFVEVQDDHPGQTELGHRATAILKRLEESKLLN